MVSPYFVIFPAHCSAIALAIPGNVLLRNFLHSSLDQLIDFPLNCDFQISLVLFSLGIICVGRKRGKPFNHKHVFLFVVCPNCQGLMIWSGLRKYVLIFPTGFSIAIFSQFAFAKRIKKSRASYCNSIGFLPSVNHLLPVTQRCVQGGNAMIISHFIFKSSSASHCRCHSGCPPLQACISQLYASCPSFRISIVTAWLSSHATKTRISSS